MTQVHPRLVQLADGTLVGELRQTGSTNQLIIICHGYQGSRTHPAIVAITRGLNQRGHATFTFDFSKAEGGIDIEQQVGDITKIVNHFKEYDEIILVAASFGALSASIAAIHVPRVKGLVTLGGFFGSLRLGREYRRTFIEFRLEALLNRRYKRIWKYFKRELQPNRIAVPVLVIHSKVDQTVYIAQSRKFFAQLTAPKQFITLMTADHDLTARQDTNAVVTEIDTWLRLVNNRGSSQGRAET